MKNLPLKAVLHFFERAGYINYSVEVTKSFEKEFKNIDRYIQKMIKACIERYLSYTENPRVSYKGLSTDKKV